MHRLRHGRRNAGRRIADRKRDERWDPRADVRESAGDAYGGRDRRSFALLLCMGGLRRRADRDDDERGGACPRNLYGDRDREQRVYDDRRGCRRAGHRSSGGKRHERRCADVRQPRGHVDCRDRGWQRALPLCVAGCRRRSDRDDGERGGPRAGDLHGDCHQREWVHRNRHGGGDR